MSTHELKSWPEYFQPMVDGVKQFDLRENARKFEAGDIVELREFDPEAKDYTGRSAKFWVTYVLGGGEDSCAAGKTALHHEFAILSLKPLGD